MKKALRVVLGIVVGLWALFSLIPVVMAVCLKTGQTSLLPAAVADHAQKCAPMLNAMPWWQVGLSALSVLFFLIAASRLFAGRRAFMTYLGAFALGVAVWWFMHMTPEYLQAFSAQERQMDYYLIGAEVVVGLLIWLAGGRSGGRSAVNRRPLNLDA